MSFTTSALASGTYTYVVYACDQTLCAAGSNAVKVLVSPIPVAPASMSAPAYATYGVAFQVSWSAATGATSYTVRATNLNSGAVTTRYSGSATSASIATGIPDTYQLAVQACDAAGCSGWTNAPNTTEVDSRNNAVPATVSSP